MAIFIAQIHLYIFRIMILLHGPRYFAYHCGNSARTRVLKRLSSLWLVVSGHHHNDISDSGHLKNVRVLRTYVLRAGAVCLGALSSASAAETAASHVQLTARTYLTYAVRVLIFCLVTVHRAPGPGQWTHLGHSDTR